MDSMFRHKEVLQIRHVGTGFFLKGTRVAQGGGLFTNPDPNCCILGTTSSRDDVQTFWQMEKLAPFNPELKFGDLVYLQNMETRTFIQSDKKRKSEVTKQSLMYMGPNPQPFLLQSLKDTQSGPFYMTDYKLLNPIRIICLTDNMALHSHNSQYKSSEVSQLKEVTGFAGRDENDLWELIPIVQQQDLSQLAYRPVKQIVHADRLIIRNIWSGLSLHSHNQTYKVSGLQEVTAMRPDRDENDWWCIYKAEYQSGIAVLNQVCTYLKHKETNKFLTCTDQKLVKSNIGTQVTCISDLPMQYWQIITLDGQALTDDKPFFIMHLPTQLYLMNNTVDSESTPSQQEVALVKQVNGKCIWIVEQSGTA